MLKDKKRAELLADIQPVLHEGEKIVLITMGLSEVQRMGQKSKRRATVAASDQRVIIFTKKLGGYELHEFPYHLISGVDFKKGLTAGNLSLSASGDHVHVSMIDKDEVEPLASAIRSQIAAHRSASTGSTGSASGDDLADQIRKLAALRDEGILSSEEFEAKKKQLLGL